MATINLIDAFWLEIVGVSIKMGDEDKAIGNAARFFRFAQEKHKSGRYVTEAEFKQHNFSEHLFPVFAKRVEGGIMAVGAEKHFGWLRQRVVSGAMGGKRSGESRRSKINDLDRSKTKQNEANGSTTNPYAYTYPFPDANAYADLGGAGEPPPPVTVAPRMHWLGELWNENSGSILPKIKKTNSHMKNIGLRLKEESAKEYWIAIIQRMAKSDFLTGKTNTPFVASFSWMISKGKDNTLNHVKVNDGNYDNRAKGGMKNANLSQYEGLGYE